MVGCLVLVRRVVVDFSLRSHALPGSVTERPHGPAVHQAVDVRRRPLDPSRSPALPGSVDSISRPEKMGRKGTSARPHHPLGLLVSSAGYAICEASI